MTDKLDIIGNFIMFRGVVVAEIKSGREVPSSLLDEFIERLGIKPGNYHPRDSYENPGHKLRLKR